MTTDTIADMLTRIRNANLAKHQIVQIPATNITRNIAVVLLTEGFIETFEELNNGLRGSLLLSLKSLKSYSTTTSSCFLGFLSDSFSFSFSFSFSLFGFGVSPGV